MGVNLSPSSDNTSLNEDNECLYISNNSNILSVYLSFVSSGFVEKSIFLIPLNLPDASY